MNKKWISRMMAGTLVVSLLSTNQMVVFAGATPDGKTDASKTQEAMDGNWEQWKSEWENLKNDWTQISLTPGSDASKLNFAWYSKETEGIPKLKIGIGKNMKHAKVYTAVQSKANKAEDGTQYMSNKVTAEELQEDTTYYYCYQVNGTYTKPEKYTTGSTDAFQFIYVGDPQIGSSNAKKSAGKDSPEKLQQFLTAQSEAVRNDSFNWNTTLNAAMEKTNNQARFVVSAGDQIQLTKAKSPDKTAYSSEIEYTGYLCPEVLKSLPVATTVGNHDADNANYTYHFNTPNNSELGSNGIVGGDYYFTYGSVLFMMLNTQDTNVAEHKQFMENAIAMNKDCKWRIVTLHQDIYGSAEHSNEPEITNLRYSLVPYFEEFDVDVVLTGHDHAYSRSKILKGGVKTTQYTDEEFDKQLKKDVDAGEDTSIRYVAPQNILSDTADEGEQAYLNYLNAVMDQNAVEQTKTEGEAVINPEGILYMTANSSSGSKYYDLVPRMQTYIANRWQEDVPTYSVIDITDTTFTINTYRTDTDEKIDDTFTIAKMHVDKSQLQSFMDDVQKDIVSKKDEYTTDSYEKLMQAMENATKVLEDKKATNAEVNAVLTELINTKAVLAKKPEEKKEEEKTNVPDKSLLQMLLQTVTSTIAPYQNLYTTESYELLATACSYADAVLRNEKASQTDIDKAYATLYQTVITMKGVSAFDTVSKADTDLGVVSRIKAVSEKTKTIKVRFSKAKDTVSGYEVKYAANKKFTSAKTVLAKGTKANIKTAGKGTYYVKVRAYKVIDGKKLYGSYSKAVRVNVK